jgi:hypothetical protein
MNFADRRHRRPSSDRFWRRLTAASAIIALGLAAAGCAQSMSEFASNTDQPASIAPVALEPGESQPVAKPAVLVDETVEPAPAARTRAPMEIAPRSPEAATAELPGDIAPSATNLNRVPDQPKTKLLTADEKAKVIAELESLAKKQSATLGKDKKAAACASDNLDPAQRVASATGDAGC